VLNFLAEREGKPYDEDGKMAAEGKVNDALLARLNALPYYQLAAPKSLDNGFKEKFILPLLQTAGLSNRDTLATYVEHLAFQIASCVSEESSKQVLLASGGGAMNKTLLARIQSYLPANVVLQLPDTNTILYKEAIIMAFLGVLRLQGKVNVLKSVTGARKDTVNGAIYHP
jgi:anhydro-N-acetylmuramic acid kinase